MEKPGKPGRRNSVRHGLLILFFLILLAFSAVSSAGADGELRVIVQAGPGPVKINVPWVITLLIDHGKPEELKVELPPLTGALILDRMRTEPRVMEGPEMDIWTRVECVFIPLRAGRAELEFLKISVPGGEFTTGSLGVDVIGDAAAPETYRPRLSWRTPLPSFTAGERSELMLLLSGRDPQKPPVFPLPFRVELSPSLILESRPPAPAEQQAGVVLVLICIPLEAGVFFLPPLSLEYRGEALSPPPLRMSAARPLRDDRTSGTAIPADNAASRTGNGETGAQKPAFPGLSPPPLPFLRASYHAAAERARSHWEAGDYGRSLAVLRQGERDLGAGPALASLRSGAEKALALEFTYDERWMPRLPLRMVCIVLFFALTVFSLSRLSAAVKILKDGDSKRRFSVYISAALLVMGLLCIGGMALTGAEPLRPRNRVILLGGPARRTPGYSGSVSAEFREGQPALIRSRIPLWLYAETYDGLSGWIPEDRIIAY
jgi:hypothetical protein